MIFMPNNKEREVIPDVVFGPIRNSNLDCHNCIYRNENDVFAGSCDVYTDLKPYDIRHGGKCDHKISQNNFKKHGECLLTITTPYIILYIVIHYWSATKYNTLICIYTYIV